MDFYAVGLLYGQTPEGILVGTFPPYLLADPHYCGFGTPNPHYSGFQNLKPHYSGSAELPNRSGTKD